MGERGFNQRAALRFEHGLSSGQGGWGNNSGGLRVVRIGANHWGPPNISQSSRKVLKLLEVGGSFSLSFGITDQSWHKGPRVFLTFFGNPPPPKKKESSPLKKVSRPSWVAPNRLVCFFSENMSSGFPGSHRLV